MGKQTNKPVKLCYSHIGGKLGGLLLENFISKGWIVKKDAADKHYVLTGTGTEAMEKMGLDLSLIKEE